jgi:hypothetical protein
MTGLEIKAFQALKNHFSDDEATTIVEYIESSKGVSEERAKNIFITEDRLTTIFATKKDLADFRTEFKTDVAGLKTELKTDIAGLRTEMAGLKTEMEKGFNNQIRWMVGVMIATASLAIAIIKLL